MLQVSSMRAQVLTRTRSTPETPDRIFQVHGAGMALRERVPNAEHHIIFGGDLVTRCPLGCCDEEVPQMTRPRLLDVQRRLLQRTGCAR